MSQDNAEEMARELADTLWQDISIALQTLKITDEAAIHDFIDDLFLYSLNKLEEKENKEQEES